MSKTKTKTKKKVNPYDSIPFGATEEQHEVLREWLDLDAKSGSGWNPHSYRGKNDILTKHNRKALQRAFDKYKIKNVVVEFDGCGDSGQIEQVLVNGETYENRASQTAYDFISHTGSTYCGDGTRNHGWALNPSLYDAIESYCYGILEGEHGGWEINGGSFGSFNFQNKNGKFTCTLEMNERIEETHSSTESY